LGGLVPPKFFILSGTRTEQMILLRGIFDKKIESPRAPIKKPPRLGGYFFRSEGYMGISIIGASNSPLAHFGHASGLQNPPKQPCVPHCSYSWPQPLHFTVLLKRVVVLMMPSMPRIS